LERELEWVRMSPKARQAKGKARLAAYERLLNEDVKQKEERLELISRMARDWAIKVIDAKGYQKSFGIISWSRILSFHSLLQGLSV